MSKWTPIEGHNHDGDYGGIIAEKMLRLMTEKMEVRHLYFKINLKNCSLQGLYFDCILLGIFFS